MNRRNPNPQTNASVKRSFEEMQRVPLDEAVLALCELRLAPQKKSYSNGFFRGSFKGLLHCCSRLFL